jgi:NAD(P)-dependent dehydrogenase (short-subunit alcohol dehydrogenase family)
MRIANSVALVTGANRGIGAAVVDALVRAGASRVYAATRASPPASADPRVVPLTLDVTDAGQVEDAANRCADVSILVNNAGIALAQPLLATSDPMAAHREMQVNYFGTLAMCRAFAPVLAHNGGGAVVNVLSILGRVSTPRLGSYAASKAASFSLTQAIRAEMAVQGTLVVGVMPAFVDTDMARRAPGPKLDPRDLASTILQALEGAVEDVYPGEAAKVALGLQRDPKAVEREFALLLSPRPAP